MGENYTLTILQFALWVLLAFPAAGSSAAHSTSTTGAQSAAQKQATRNPHGPLNIPCENCHTAAGWRPIRAVPEFDHNKTQYPLRGLHEKVNCVQCHVKPVFINVAKNCADCHADIHRRQMGSDCAQCHTVNGWNQATQQVKDHQNRFPLLGAHAAVPCDSCHKSAAVGQFLGLSTQCDSCHLKDWQNTTNPPHASAGPAFASSQCAGCHSFDSWLGAKFDHSTTGFQLTNGHANLACTACHINNNYNLKVAPTACGTSGCHLSTWQTTNNPPHPQAGPTFAAANCYNCHQSTVSWNLVTFDHSSTGFLLTNGHANRQCTDCHINNNYNLKTAPTDCGNSGCHLTTWQTTNNPPHQTAGTAFATANCSNCHNTVSWTTSTFDHSTTGFLLVDGHANVACAACHVNNNYNLQTAPTDCGNSGCHLTKWQQTTTPVHSTSGPNFAASNCANCHTPKGWDSAAFDHSVTGFALVGTHATTPCANCHINNNYGIKTADCLSCHTPDWNKTATLGGSVPNHVASNFPTSASACSSCHTITTWADGKFDHSSTGFPLTNSHQLTPAGKVTGCIQCHVGGNYTLTTQPNDCGNSGCHLTTWQQTNNPTHSTSGAAFAAANCATCHNTISWTTAAFDHSTTGFALVGTHMSPTPTPCLSCHVNNNYTLSSADCMSCHTPDWNKTATIGGNVPNHVSSNFPNTASACSSCHTITTWADGKFDHSSTGFPLTNSHQLTPAGKVTGCTQCHVGGNYTLTTQPNDCGNSGCHLTTWQQTNNPTHSTAGAPFAAANCSTCHNTITWTTANFNHSSTGWPLTGIHLNTPCANCHINNNYNFTSANTDCYGCHQDKYNGTATMGGTVPNHVSAGFPTAQCSTCHTTTNWTSTWSHNTTGFTLVGTHATTPCISCHVSNNYTLTSANTDCMGCHQSAWNLTPTYGGNVPDHIKANFPTSAAACSSCHTITVWTDGKFDHSTTGWPLTGGHIVPSAAPGVQQCSDCHVNGNYTLTSANTDCYGCHQAAYTSTATMGGTVPNHVSAGFPTNQCINCHNTSSWKSTWSHSATGFNLVGTHATTPCIGCHVGNNYTLSTANTDCLGCHLSAWNLTPTYGGNVPDHIKSNFPQTAAACAGCHTITVWTDGKFDHSTTGWPLTGGHVVPSAPPGVQQCSDCHVAGNYTLTAANTACYGCHVAQWTSTQTLGGAVPNHIAGGFPTTCDTAGCHNTTSWLGATFNHTYFPIPHHGSVCNDCHQVSTDFSSFTCINCHTTTAHQQTETNNKHGGVNGYTYTPTSCYNCHKNGGG